MKSLFISITFCGIISVFLTTCSKDNQHLPATVAAEKKTVNIIKAWITSQKSLAPSSIQKNIDSLILFAKWDQTIQTKVAGNKNLLFVPLNDNKYGL
jgi:hypothetical protein